MSELKMIKAIIFDFGGVIVDYFGVTKEALRNFRISFLNLRKVREITNFYYNVERGKNKSEQFIKKFSLMFNISEEKVRKFMFDRYYKDAKIKKGMLELIKKLGKKYKIALLSNTIKEHALFNSKRRAYRLFNPIILSCRVGARKPERKIYLLALKKLKLKPRECIFVDDELPYLNGAKKAGIKTILFKNIKQLKRDLAGAGIKC